MDVGRGSGFSDTVQHPDGRLRLATAPLRGGRVAGAGHRCAERPCRRGARRAARCRGPRTDVRRRPGSGREACRGSARGRAPSTPRWQGARALGRRDRAHDRHGQRRSRAATHRRGAPSARARTDPRRHDLALHRMGAPPPRRHRRESSCSRGIRPTARRQGVHVLRRLDDGKSDQPTRRPRWPATNEPTNAPYVWASSS